MEYPSGEVKRGFRSVCSLLPTFLNFLDEGWKGGVDVI